MVKKTKYENNSKTVFEIAEQNSKDINNAIQSMLSNKKDIGKIVEGKVADYIPRLQWSHHAWQYRCHL